MLFYNSLRHGMAYHDPGASQYEERYRSRVIRKCKRRAKAFGFILHEMPGGLIWLFLRKSRGLLTRGDSI